MEGASRWRQTGSSDHTRVADRLSSILGAVANCEVDGGIDVLNCEVPLPGQWHSGHAKDRTVKAADGFKSLGTGARALTRLIR